MRGPYTVLKRPELIIASINGDLRRGGWTASGQVLGDTDAVHQGLNLVIKGKSLASFVDSDNRVALNCHIIANPDYSFDRYSSQANFQAGTVDRFLEAESIQDISFADVASPSNSHEATSWNFGQVITHILQQHCNYIYDADGSNGSPDGVVTLTNIDITDSTTFELFIVNQSNNMWRTLQAIAGGEEGGGEFYRIYCTRENKIVYQPAPPFISPKLDSIGTITKEHIRGPVRVQLHNSQPGARVGQVQIMTVANSTTVYSAQYPANPTPGKIFQKKSGIWAQSQGRSDILAERLYKWLTRAWTIQIEVDAGLVLFGDDGRGLELGDRLLLTYDGPAENSVTGAGVHLDIEDQSVFVYGADVRYDPVKREGVATLTLEMDNNP